MGIGDLVNSGLGKVGDAVDAGKKLTGELVDKGTDAAGDALDKVGAPGGVRPERQHDAGGPGFDGRAPRAGREDDAGRLHEGPVREDGAVSPQSLR